MKVVLGTHGRFHSFDLARELVRRGVFGGIWTQYPASKVSDEGLPPGTTHCASALTYVRHGLDRIGRMPTRLIQELEWQRGEAIDRATRKGLPADADALVALSGGGLGAGREMQRRGGVYFCDRGSTHIRYQEETLREEYALYGVPFEPFFPRMVEKEEAEYAQADRILVPTAFVAKTFADKGVPAEKLRRALYGVNLTQFYPTARPPEDSFEVVFVGALSIRKGMRYLLEGFERLEHPKKRLTLVGGAQGETADLIAKAVARGDVVATGTVGRDEVRERMSRSHVLVLPSVEDGMGMVQTQAMACGCPVIATTNTGCEEIFEDGKEGFAVRMRDGQAIADRLQELADRPDFRDEVGEAARRRVQTIGGWQGYGDLVVGHLREALAAKGR